ncbi:uncharacterized protein TRAVEDRAFT_30789 [Trametes versicolor FP-101664 SS1]|uniref:uncharacterized protein n=1 Tax=Trametes versicolor (strain FP-101664) TaxID=717944 RepID=UPI0004622FDE|nr:uncharacterized protein TRAVEDRAFT_30789 [Trametes versicolor FP-101664 SS1]EIW54724.1 hypothetical protein TRAVEDRAFT_30789 [Trametes versicolor FP-101664 SS1]
MDSRTLRHTFSFLPNCVKSRVVACRVPSKSSIAGGASSGLFFSPRPRCLRVNARSLRVGSVIRHSVGGSNLRISSVPSRPWVSVVARRSRDRRHATPLVTLVFVGQVLFANLKQSYGVSATLHQRPELSPSTAGAGSVTRSGASDEDSWWTRQILRKATTPGAPSRQKQHTRLLCFS